MTIQQREVCYQHGDVTLRGVMVYDDSLSERPAVLVAPTWAGCTAFEIEQAERLAGLGYVGFAIDMYGEGATGGDKEECTALMTPLVSDRALLQARMSVAVDAIRAEAEVAQAPTAAIGLLLWRALCARLSEKP